MDTSTDLQLQWALQRRGLAFDQCALISNSEHEIWVQQLLSQLTKDPPTGYARVSASQVIRADREMFTLMAQEIEGSLQSDAAGRFPMEKKMKELRTDPRVTMYMLPLPKGAPRENEKIATGSSSTASGNLGQRGQEIPGRTNGQKLRQKPSHFVPRSSKDSHRKTNQATLFAGRST